MKPFIILMAICIGCAPSASDVRLAAYGAEQIRCVDENNTPEAARACIASVRSKFVAKLDGGHE